MRAAWYFSVLVAALAGCGQGTDSGATPNPPVAGTTGTGLTGSFPPASAATGGMGAAPAAPPQGSPNTTPDSAVGRR